MTDGNQTARRDGPGLMRGLSGKVLAMTILFVMLGEVLIFLPSIANFRIQWLKGRIAQAEIAALAAEAAPDRILSTDLRTEILKGAGVLVVSLTRGDKRQLMLRSDTDHMIECTQQDRNRIFNLGYYTWVEQQNTPLVVFAEHVEPIEALRNRDGWAVIASGSATISGKPCTHAEAVAAFQAGTDGVIGFAGTIASAGDAITLTHASRMHFVDLAYSHRLNAQAFERCHRPGQHECVHISTFVPDHPIVRHVAAVLSRKAGFAATVLDSQSEVGSGTPSRSAALASDLDADASERRAIARARVLRLALAPADPSAAATIERGLRAPRSTGSASSSPPAWSFASD